MSKTKTFSIATKHQNEIEKIFQMIDSRDVSRFICKAIIEKAEKTLDFRAFDDDEDFFATANKKKKTPIITQDDKGQVNPLPALKQSDEEKNENTPIETSLKAEKSNPLVEKVMEMIKENPLIIIETPEVVSAITSNDIMVLAKVISDYSQKSNSKDSINEEKTSALKNITKDW